MRYVSLGLFIFALMLMQVLVGGAGFVFSLPPSILLALGGVLLVFSKREMRACGNGVWTTISWP